MKLLNISLPHITPYEKLSLVTSILALMLSIVAFVETRNYNIKSQDYYAVISAESEESLKEIAAPCKEIDFVLINLSQFSSKVQVKVEVEGLSVHWPRGEGQECPTRLNSSINLPARIVKAGGEYVAAFSVHTLSPKPKTTGIKILMNGNEFRNLSYVFNDERGVYELDGTNP